jgi:hypothetical protein
MQHIENAWPILKAKTSWTLRPSLSHPHPECGSSRTSIFSTDGEFIKSFGIPGFAEGEFGQPQGQAVDEDETVCVSDKIFNRQQFP